MFEDLEEDQVDVTPDSPDRTIAWSIWSRGVDSPLSSEEAWAILFERYPEEPRFLLLNAYAELSETRRQSEARRRVARRVDTPGLKAPADAVGTWALPYFLKKLERVVSSAEGDALGAHVRDMLVFCGPALKGVRGDDARRFTDLRSRVGGEEEEPTRDDRDRAGLRLRRFEREVLKEISERTQDNRPLGTRAPAPDSPGTDWASAVADPSRPRRRYSPDALFECGEIVEHPKFGVGVVSGTECGKAIVLFESGRRKLVASNA